MCRWLTYSGKPIYLEKLIFEPENSLIHQSLHARQCKATTNGDGFGLGWYGAREEPGIYRETLPAWNDRNLKSLAHQLSAGLFFAHVRASTGTATSRANCHPFSHCRWMFMHNGQIGGYERLRRPLEQLIPDALYPYRQGTTDSELIFFLLFRFGLEQDPAAALARTMRVIEDAMATEGVTEPLRITAALSNGIRTWTMRYASDDEPPSLYFSCDGEGLTVVSEPLEEDGSNRWKHVPPGHILTIEGGCQLSLARFDV